MYKSGDIACLLPCGELDCLGRADDQIKLNGLRIEPGEIEKAILTFPGISKAVVLLRKGRWAMIKFILTLLLKKHPRPSNVLIQETTSVTIRSSIPSAAQVDGEYLGPLPFHFAMSDVHLRIIVPKEFQAG